ncbi:hypothetical protein HKCCE2091_18840 [Rhodobacterales bacterium HKCCE2091]|nr:hypothetical protein [Rhodobacterales bacterium HKCCE2091]
MNRLRLVLFALDAASRAGINHAGAAMAGGELRRRRTMAYTRLYEEAVGELIGRDTDPR